MNSTSEISRETREALIECAREMRKNPTHTEALLWQHLRKEQYAGFKFRRQHIIQAFIVDFYCPAAKLVIEVDGSVHETQREYDQEREADLRALGYRVLRFTNERVIHHMPAVLAEIHQMLLSA